VAVDMMGQNVPNFSEWYVDYDPDGRDGCLEFRGISPTAASMWREFDDFKREMDARVSGYDVLEKIADGEVINKKPDLPNVSSGETAGLVRRIARNLVQNTPNVEVISKFDDDKPQGIFARHVLGTKIIGSDQYSNDMQQNLFACTKTALTLGFSCVLPQLTMDAAKGWHIHFDSIHYRDVFPEPGVKDVRDAPVVYVRRYLTRGEAEKLVLENTPGWDISALKRMLKNSPPNRELQSVAHQDKKHHAMTPKGYEVITRYTNDGMPFLTFDGREKLLLRIEKNKHPLKQHPVHFLVLEKDDQQPLGKSQVELLVGRQDFQDLMLNGAMKLWYRNINPSIIGYGTVNAIPNLSPGKYTQISNPNAKVEAFEVSTQTLLQYGQISEQNLGSMVNMLGSADQQMATQAGNGMSATPQGVEAQVTMVDITTNNYQKAIEAFFGKYCSYALTIYFQELKAVKKVELTADARSRLLGSGMPLEELNDDGTYDVDYEELAVEYWVRTVPGSLIEMEDEKQLRILNQMFIPLSQALPALVQSQDPEAVRRAAMAMAFIVGKQLELSGSTSAYDLKRLWQEGDVAAVDERQAQIAAVEDRVTGVAAQYEVDMGMQHAAIAQLQEQMTLMAQNQQALLEKLGVGSTPSGNGSAPVQEGVNNAAPAPVLSQ
jgi:hypothetical protein